MTVKPHTGIRTFEMTVSVTVPLEGRIEDWPAKIQDGIYKALEAKSHEAQLPLAIVFSRCAEDHDVAKDVPGRYYLHVIASEVVMADERTLTPGTVVPTIRLH